MDTEFYTMFTVGLESHIGQRVKRDCAVSIEIVVELQSMAERMDREEVMVRDDVERMYEVVEWASYFLCAFHHSLRGWEMMKAIISQLQHQIIDEDEALISGTVSHLWAYHCMEGSRVLVVTPIHNLCMISGTTALGLQLVKLVKRLLECMERIPPKSDWLFQTRSDVPKSMTDFDDIFYESLLEIQKKRNNIIDEEIDVIDGYHLARSFRRGASTTRAQLAEVLETTVNWVNLWGTGMEILVKGPMRVIYSERKLMLSHFLKFSGAL
jgi:hypothetical protein